MRRLLLGIATTIALAGSSVAVGAPAQAATPTTYHVDCSVKERGDGSLQHPWNALSSANGHGAFLPGERILLKRGTTCRGRLAPSGSGRGSAPIIVGAYGKGARPTIAGGGTATQTATVQLTNVHHWTVQDIRITNIGKSRRTTGYRAGLLFLNTGVGRLPGLTAQRLLVEDVASNVTMKYSDAREWGGIAAITYGVQKDGFDGLKIIHNTLADLGRTGIVVSNKEHGKGWDLGVRISANTIKRARGDSIVLRGSRNGRIDHNVSANGGAMLPCPECGGVSPDTANAAIWPAQSENIRIDHNEVYGQHVWGGDGEGFDIDSSTKNVVLEYNYAHDNQGGGVLFCGSRNAVARFNIFENNGKSAFAFIGTYPAHNTQIYNNTVYNSAQSKARIVRYFNGARGSGISFKNNLLYNYGLANYAWPVKKVATAANTLVGKHGAGRPTDGRTIWRDPGLKKPGSGKNGFKSLTGYKPLRSASAPKGVAIPKSVTTDFFGKRINPATPPRGAAG